MIDLDKYEWHTPGPWEYYWRVDDENHADCGVYALRRPGQAYAVARCPKYQSKIQWNADASLIAAAPELLAEVKRLRQDLHDTIRESQQYRAERDEAIEALRELSHYAETSDDCQYGTLSTRLVRDIANPVLAKHGDAE